MRNEALVRAAPPARSKPTESDAPEFAGGRAEYSRGEPDRVLCRLRRQRPMITVDFFDFAALCLGDVKPRKTFVRKVLFSHRLKLRGPIEGADMKMRFCRPGETFASQGRSASGAKSAPRSPGRGIELAYLAFGNGISPAVEYHEDSDWRASMPSTTLAMTPIYALGLTSRDKTDRAAQTATFKLLGCVAHDLILLGLNPSRKAHRAADD